MSDGRGQSGVRSLLARFENNNINNSPISHGRPLTDPDRPAPIRPLSKVRASFVAVERSGPAAPGTQLWGLKKADEIGDVSAGKPKVSGSAVNDVVIPIEKSMKTSSAEGTDKALLGKSAISASPDRASLNEGIGPEKGLPSQPSDTPTSGKHSTGQGISRASTLPREAQELGTILKGSPFEDSPRTTTTKIEPKLLESLRAAVPQQKEEAVLPAANANGKPKESMSPKKSAVSGTSSRPLDNFTSGDVARKPSPTRRTKSPILPRTPRTPVSPESHTTTKTTPMSTSTTPREPDTYPSRITTRKASRASLKPANDARDDTLKTALHNSPGNKSRTRSPSRPLRLSSVMTAQTASSAAKLKPGGGPPSRSPSRTAINAPRLTRKPSTLRSDRATSVNRSPVQTASTVRKQPSRPSLATNQPNSSHDRPRSRVSNASLRGPDESFLARMMRPTASSASKMHEKVETRSPPRLARAAKPPRKSLGGEDSRSKAPSTTKIVEAPKSNGNSEVPRETEPNGMEESDAVPAAGPTAAEERPLPATASNDP